MAQCANYHCDPKTHPKGFPAIDYMNFTARPEPKEIDLTDERAQAQIDKEVFGL